MPTAPARRPRSRRTARAPERSRRARTPVGAAIAALAVATAACTHTATSVPPPASTTTPVVVSTTSTVPAAPQPTAEGAADALVAAWAAGDRASALTVATPAAVDTLFAVAYPKGQAISRGCSTAFPPIVCTYGPPGGGPITAALYQLSASQGPSGGWYVGSVQVLS